MNPHLINPLNQSPELLSRFPLQTSKSLTSRDGSSKNLKTITVDFSILPSISEDGKHGCAITDCEIRLRWDLNRPSPDYIEYCNTGLELGDDLDGDD